MSRNVFNYLFMVLFFHQKCENWAVLLERLKTRRGHSDENLQNNFQPIREVTVETRVPWQRWPEGGGGVTGETLVAMETASQRGYIWGFREKNTLYLWLLCVFLHSRGFCTCNAAFIVFTGPRVYAKQFKRGTARNYFYIKKERKDDSSLTRPNAQ